MSAVLSQRVTIAMLGRLEVRHGSRVITRFRSQRTAALLAYLALHLPRSHSRDELVELFWSDSDPESGRASLRTSLSSLRRQLEPPGIAAGSILMADRSHVRLNPAAVTTDVSEFDRLAKSPGIAGGNEPPDRLLGAVDLYNGPLLPGHYDPWVQEERERLETAYLVALRQLIALLEGASQHERAVRYAQRAVALDPLSEESHADLIRLQVALGRRAEAQRQYDQLVTILREEVGDEPSASTRALLENPASASVRGTGETATTGGLCVVRARDPIELGDLPHALDERGPICLPVPLTRFFGRTNEIDQLATMLCGAGSRLVTLTGAGGAGKSRLCVEAASRVADHFRGGIWFVPLADVVDGRLVGDAVVAALGLEAADHPPALDRAAEALNRRAANGRMLVVLDNFEQVVTSGAAFVKALLGRVSKLSCLVTSRRRLNIEGERELPLLPLPVPTDDDNTQPRTPEELTTFPGIELFADRAQAVRPDFQVTPGNSSSVAALCARLEGIPLALELAAARARILTPAQMVEWLDQRLDLLVAREGERAARHSSLRAAVEWSYQLLSPEQQRVFAMLSVFRGAFDLDAVQHVCAESETPRGAATASRTLETLSELCDHSLLVVEEAGAQMRYRLLETLREYGWEQLGTEERARVKDRHLAHFLSLAEWTDRDPQGPEQAAWLERMDVEHDNLRAALDWCGERETARTAGLRLAVSLAPYWNVRGHRREGLERLDRLFAITPPAEPRIWSQGLFERAHLAFRLADVERAAELAAECIEYSGRTEWPISEARALYVLGLVYWQQSRFDEANLCLRESLPIYRSANDQSGLATALNTMGVIAINQLDYDSASAFYHESLSLHREVGNQNGIATVLQNLGDVASCRGEFAVARDHLTESLDAARGVGNRGLVAVALGTLGDVAMAQGDFREATARYAEALRIQRHIAEGWNIARTLVLLGDAAFSEGSPATADGYYKQGLELHGAIAADPWTVPLLERLAKTADAVGDLPRAARLLGAADIHRTEEIPQLPPVALENHERHVAAVRERIAGRDLIRARDEGRAMTLSGAVEFALTVRRRLTF